MHACVCVREREEETEKRELKMLLINYASIKMLPVCTNLLWCPAHLYSSVCSKKSVQRVARS